MNSKVKWGARLLTGFALAGALFAFPMQAKAANLIVNGGFENPSVATWSLFASISGWTATSDLIEIGNGAPVYGITGSTGQVLELDANHNATVEQSLNLSAGIYSLDFDYARRLNGMSGRPANTADFDVLWNGNVIASFSPGSTTMTHYSTSLLSVAGVNTLAFRGMGTDDSYGALIDNVAIDNAVPEPGSVTLAIGMGVIGVGFMRRRKRA